MLFIAVNYSYRDAQMVYGCSPRTWFYIKRKHHLSYVSEHKISGSGFALGAPSVSLVNA